MKAFEKKCPKCGSGLELEMLMGGQGIRVVQCRGCGVKGMGAFTDDRAWMEFGKAHGNPVAKPVSLSEIEVMGGPRRNTMVFRVASGHYPDAFKEGRAWMLPVETAERVIAENKNIRRGDLVPLPDAAVRCGLKRRSLNPRVRDLDAVNVAGRWFLSESTVVMLEKYYAGVTTTEAAEILGLNHRASVIHLVRKERLRAMRVGSEYRIRRKDLRHAQVQVYN